MKKEELQSRRDFFKKAAKGVLPILSAVLLANVPNVLKAEETPMGCTGTCYTTCRNACQGCRYTCENNCKNSCLGCRYTCDHTCKNGCERVSR